MLLLSIRPTYVDAILNGSKRIEFRRRVPRQAAIGSELAIYASSPVCALVCVARIASIVESNPTRIWQSYSSVGGISKADFWHYFIGTNRAAGIILTDVRRLCRPVCLRDLRERWVGFHPPQQFAYLDENRRAEVIKIPCEYEPSSRTRARTA